MSDPIKPGPYRVFSIAVTRPDGARASIRILGHEYDVNALMRTFYVGAEAQKIMAEQEKTDLAAAKPGVCAHRVPLNRHCEECDLIGGAGE